MDFRILGPLEALDGSRPVALGGRRRRAVLAALLLHPNETLSNERLIDELWGESPPANAIKTLQVNVSRLRKALPEDVLVTRGHGYELRVEGEQVDAQRFERLLDEGRAELAAERPARALDTLERALELWRGAPLADLAYEPFAQAEIARLSDLRVTADEQLIDAKLALGRHGEVIGPLERMVEEHPYRERLRAQLMLALYRADRQADALQAYQDARRQLVEELGIEPGERLRELEAAVLAQDPSLTVIEPEAPPPPQQRVADAGLPGGVVTFLMTDIERSSALWESNADAMAASLALHDELIARCAEEHRGRLLKTKGEGDSTVTVFPSATDALECAAALRESLAAVDWHGDLDLRVRAALHTGEAHQRGGDYFGPALNRTARLRGMADGGTTLLSQATRELVHDSLPPGTELVDLGTHELRDLSRPERVFELRALGDAGRMPAPPREIRKTVTAVFACLVEDPDHDADAEARRRDSAQALAAARTVLERHGATVDEYAGEALMAVFGVPLLHEDDALRAVRASVELRRMLPGRARIGVATDEVIAEREPGRAPLATGAATGAARRMQEAAAPDEIAVDSATRRLVRDSVALDPEPDGSFRVAALHADGARTPSFSSPLVGRTQQLRALQSTFDAAVADRGCHLVTVLGAAGVGKSRVVEEMTARLGDAAMVLRGRCLPYGEGITYWPLNEVVHDLARAAGGGSPASVRATLAAELSGDPKGEQAADVLAEAVGLGDTGGHAEEKIFWAARRLFEVLAERRPLVVVLDDLQWAEATFLDLVEHMADFARGAPLLFLCLARPELLDARRGWAGGKLNATSILLEPLGPAETRELVDNLVDGLSPDAAERVAAACEGHPLFAEELLAMLIEDGLFEQAEDGWALTGVGGTLPVPPTIQALLGARVDRLPDDERTLLTHVSVEGALFHRESMHELAPPALRPVVDRCLGELVRRDLIRPERGALGDDEAFRFRHILVRDAAYRSLPKATRAELHERFGAWLEEAHAGRLGEFEEIVGYHLEQACRFHRDLGATPADTAALAGRAADRLESAGRRAQRRSDHRAAAGLFERAAALLAENDPRRTALLPDLGAALTEAGRLPDAERVLAEAIVAAETAGDELALSHALVQQQLLAIRRSAPDAAAEAPAVVERVVPVFRAAGDEQGLCSALRLRGWGLWLLGRAEDAGAAWEEAVEHARAAGLEHERTDLLGWIASSLFWGPTPVGAAIERCEAIRADVAGNLVAAADVLQPLAGFHAMEGRFEEARALIAAAEAAFEELGRSLGSAVSHHAAVVEMLAGDPAAAERVLRRGYAALEEMGERAVLSTTAAFLGEALLAQGQVEEAGSFALLSAGQSAEDDMHSQGMWRALQAAVLAERGKLPDAERFAREGIEFVERTDDLNQIADAHVVLARVLARRGDTDAAHAELSEALRVYVRKGNLVGAERVRADLAPPARV
ncbi:MAG TPA: BTAD domain-containing putative transcriptional regulator [Thermoleophilaceae bacterium]